MYIKIKYKKTKQNKNIFCKKREEKLKMIGTGTAVLSGGKGKRPWE